MKKLFLVLGVIGLFVLTFTLAFSYGRKIEKDVIPIKLATIQAMLAFNHLQRYRELESDLSKGCLGEALEKTKISKDIELKLLASFLNEHGDTWVNKYISDRDPSLLEKLKVFRSAYGDSWTEPTCRK